MIIKPILKWAGGKTKILEQLVPHFPENFKGYWEPFFGGGAVFFTLNLKGPACISDKNKELMNVYEVVRNVPRLLMKELDKLQKLYSEEFYYELRANEPFKLLDQAARTIFLNKTCFNGLYRQNNKGEFNVPFGKRKKCPKLYDEENMLRVSQALYNVSIFASDFEEVIDMAQPGDCVYCDPPYDPISKTSSFHAYQSGGFSREDQKRLKEACVRAQQRGVHVLISNSSSTFIKDLYGDCVVETIFAPRFINAQSAGRGPVEESLILLRP